MNRTLAVPATHWNSVLKSRLLAVAVLAPLTLFAGAAARHDPSPQASPQTAPGTAAPQKKSDPYFTPTGARTTAVMPKVIIRNIREDRSGNIWFATFGGPIRYDGKEFTNFGEEVGIPSTRIFSLLEDRSGAMWFGSITGGASRYDGKTFTKFTEKEGLAGNDVTWIFEDRDGNLWLGTNKGVSRYDGKAGGGFTNFSTKDGLSDNNVYAICQDSIGRIWFGTQGGICCYNGTSFSNITLQVGRTFTNVRAVAIDHAGNLWFGGQDGAFRYDGRTLTSFNSRNGLLDDFVGSIIVDHAGNIWLGYPGRGVEGGGASRYDGKSFKHFTKADGLNSGNVYAMGEDTRGNIWFGSVDAGACRYDGKTFTNFSAAVQGTNARVDESERKSGQLAPLTSLPPAPPPAAPVAKGEIVADIGDSCWYVFQDKDNNYWFGSDGNGVFRFDGKIITRFTTKDGLSNDHIRGIQQHGTTGHILISTLGAVSKFDGQRFTTLPVTEMKSPEEGWVLNPDDVWLFWQPKQMGPYRYDGKKLYHLKFPKSPREDAYFAGGSSRAWSPYEVYCVYKDRRGQMWFGTSNLGVYRFDGQHVDWMYEDQLTNPPGGGSFGIRSIIEDKSGDFWFCNTQYRFDIQPHDDAGPQAGLIKYQRKPGMDLSAITTDKFIYYQSVTEDNNGDLWMAPYAGGVWKYDGKKVTHYPMKSGDKEITMFTIYQDNRGGLWVGTHEHGAYRFNGTTFERFKP